MILIHKENWVNPHYHPGSYWVIPRQNTWKLTRRQTRFTRDPVLWQSGKGADKVTGASRKLQHPPFLKNIITLIFFFSLLSSHRTVNKMQLYYLSLHMDTNQTHLLDSRHQWPLM